MGLRSLREAWLNIQLMSYEWLILTHLVLWLKSGFQAFGSQHFGWGNLLEMVAAVVAGMVVFGTGLGSHQEEERVGARIGIAGHWP